MENVKNNFFLVMCKDRKQFDRYVKKNKIKNKYIIDITTICKEEELEIDDISNSDIFKILLLKRFNLAKEKKKDIFYIPDFENKSQIERVFNIKKLFENTHNFNLLYVKNKFDNQDIILNRIEEFYHSQLLPTT